MGSISTILLLDDDPYHLAVLTRVLEAHGYLVLACETPERAERQLGKAPDFAIVDLFLRGDLGDELSNNFIRDHLVPRGIRYGRMTSAPELVPQEYRGAWVLHKRHFRDNPVMLLDLLAAYS